MSILRPLGEPLYRGGAAPPGPPRQRLLQQVRQARARGQVGAGVTAADDNQHSIEIVLPENSDDH